MCVCVSLLNELPVAQVRVLLTQRSMKLRTHAGEVAFPGGKEDATDVDAVETALREAHEEVALKLTRADADCVDSTGDASDSTVIGCLPPVMSKHGLVVTPVLAYITAQMAAETVASELEVEAIFSPPLTLFTRVGDDSVHRSMAVEHQGETIRMHFFAYDDPLAGSFTIFGLTAAILVQVATLAYADVPPTTPARL